MNKFKITILFSILLSIVFTGCGGTSLEQDKDKESPLASQTAINKISAYTENHTELAPSLFDYQIAGVRGVTIDSLSKINSMIKQLKSDEVDTLEEIQHLVNSFIYSSHNDSNPLQKPTLTSFPPNSTNKNNIQIEISGEIRATVWVNNIEKGSIPLSGRLIINLDLSGNNGVKEFSIILKNSQNKSSTALIFTIFKTNSPDTIKPVITLNGNNTITIIQGDEYNDAGAIAIDNVDGDITANIITINNIDTSKVGVYTVTYNVKDQANNAAIQLFRTVEVISNHTPQASNIFIKGNLKAGEILTLEYIFYDKDNDKEVGSIITWSISSKEMQTGKNKSFIIPTGYEGETIEAIIVPIDNKGFKGSTHAASNNGLKILSQYEKAITLPKFDSQNPKMILIKSDADWVNINNPDIQYFFVEPGDYSNAGNDNYGRVKLTASGTANAKRYIILHNGNNKHSGKLKRNKLAKVSFVLDGAKHWIIDRMSYWDSPTTINPIIVKNNSSYNIFNRLYFHNVGSGLYIYPYSHENTVQNSRIERNDISIYHDRAAIGLYNNGDPNALIKNTRIINNEIYNFVDGVQTIRKNINNTQNNNFEGTIIDNNHFYIDETIYTDCNGNHDRNGNCAYAENALDLKIGSSNPKNPMIISNNKMWGFRKSDVVNSYLGDTGAAMPIHYGVNYTIIRNNIIFNSAVGFSIADPRFGASIRNSIIENNIFRNIKGTSLFIADSEKLTIKNNLQIDIGANNSNYWMAAYNNKNLKLTENITVSTHNKTARLKQIDDSFIALNNTYYNSDYSEIADTLSNTDILLDSDPSANYKDLVFITDRYTNHPRKITVPSVLKPE